jgi:hypothetical protein
MIHGILSQDALSMASNIEKKEVEVDGTTFYQYDIDSPVSELCQVCSYMYIS